MENCKETQYRLASLRPMGRIEGFVRILLRYGPTIIFVYFWERIR